MVVEFVRNNYIKYRKKSILSLREERLMGYFFVGAVYQWASIKGYLYGFFIKKISDINYAEIDCLCSSHLLF